MPVLLYEGDKDFICNWLGNHAWSDAWTIPNTTLSKCNLWRPWHTKEGKLAGEVKNYGIFTFCVRYDAGHMVLFGPTSANSLDMVNRWIVETIALDNRLVMKSVFD